MPSLRPIFKGLRIRFARYGCTNRPFYHIVCMERHRAQRDAIKEQLGTYDPLPNKDDNIMISLNFERIRYWLGRGAVPSQPIGQLFGLCGFFPVHPMSYVEAKRNLLEKERLQKLDEWKQEKEKSES